MFGDHFLRLNHAAIFRPDTVISLEGDGRLSITHKLNPDHDAQFDVS